MASTAAITHAHRRGSQTNLPDFFSADASNRRGSQMNLPDFYSADAARGAGARRGSATHLPDYFSTSLRSSHLAMPKTEMRHCSNCHAYAVFEPAPPRLGIPRLCCSECMWILDAAAVLPPPKPPDPVAELRKKRLWSHPDSEEAYAAQLGESQLQRSKSHDAIASLGATRTRLRRGVTACDLHSVRGYRDRERAEQSEEAARLVDAFARHGLRVDRDAIARGLSTPGDRAQGEAAVPGGSTDTPAKRRSLALERQLSAAVDALGLDGDATTGGGTPLWIQARTLSSEKYAAVVAEAHERDRVAALEEPTHAVLDAEERSRRACRRRRWRRRRRRRRRMRRRRRRRPSGRSRPQRAEVGSPRRQPPRGSGRGRR